MGLLDSIGSKISEVGKGVSDQSKALTETTKLNFTISSNEKAITELYAELGKEYFNSVKDAPAELGETFVNKINNLLAENEKLKTSINTIKGVVVCESCKVEMPSTAACCSACGAALPKVVVPTCTGCGATLSTGVAFCAGCGQKVEDAQ